MSDVATDRTALLERIETFYDTVPRASADTEEVGPFTLFVARPGTGHPFYGRPSLGSTAFDPGDVARLLARQQALALPRALEWVEEVSPGLSEAVAAAGHDATRHPLLVHEVHAGEPVPIGVEPLDGDDSRLPDVLGAIHAGFAGTDEAHPEDPGSRVAALAAGHLLLVGAFDAEGRAVGGGMASPRGGTAELAGIAVLPRARCRGLGAAITSALVAAGRERGCTTLFLSAMDEPASRVYQRVGFRRIATAWILDGDD